jgi:flagellar basal body-associated protein FliL
MKDPDQGISKEQEIKVSDTITKRDSILNVIIFILFLVAIVTLAALIYVVFFSSDITF